VPGRPLFISYHDKKVSSAARKARRRPPRLTALLAGGSVVDPFFVREDARAEPHTRSRRSIRMRLRDNHGRHPAPRKARPLPDAKVIARQERWWYRRNPLSSERSPFGAVGDVAARVPVPHRAKRGCGSTRRESGGCAWVGFSSRTSRSVPGVVLSSRLFASADALSAEVSVRGRGAKPNTERIVGIRAVRTCRAGRR